MAAVGGNAFRADIQGLRAIAVGAVLIYHVWPSWLPGGYIGVDVFFVISGYLITGLLVRELDRTGTIGLREFYARRIRRLLPASAATLFAIAAATVIWMPVSDWSDIASELLASAFYVQNLLLVGKQVDYLAFDAAPSPLLHFWSLSIEEQFYIFWPLIMVGMAALAARKGWALRRTLLFSLLTICVLSLAHAVHISFANPAPGYFLTTTRVWELGLGGLLAIIASATYLPQRPRVVLAWLGLGAILVSALFYSHRLPFPGYEALLPTLGTAVILYAALDGSNVMGRWLASAPMQYIGDISYSLYLWHWPIIIFYPYVTGQQPDTLQDGVFIIVVSIFCAHLSRELVEERFRRSRASEFYRPYAMAGVLALGVAGVSLMIAKESDVKTQNAFEAMASVQAYPGAMAVVNSDLVAMEDRDFIPAAELARLDRGSAYDKKGGSRCISSVRSDEVSRCVYGPQSGSRQIVIVGDSHAVHWLPALELIAASSGWRVTALTKSSCAFSAELVGISSSGASREYTECKVWGEKVLDTLLSERPDLVILSHSARHRAPGRRPGQDDDKIAQGVMQYTRALHAAGIKVAALQHTPWQVEAAPQCMARPGATVGSCSTPESRAVYPATLARVAANDPSVTLIEVLPYFCQEGVCPAVIGGVLVYRDRHHMTATYARSLAPILEQKLKELL